MKREDVDQFRLKFIFGSLTVRTRRVLQAEAGFVAFSHLGPIESQQVVVGEHLDAVVMSANRNRS